MKTHCKTCNDKLILGINFTEADVRYGKVNCKKCQGIYAKKLRERRTLDQRLRRKITSTLSKHKNWGYIVEGSIEEYVETFTGKCAFCGEKFDIFSKDRYKTGSLDRATDNKVISPNNVQWLCHKCNITKQNRSNIEFLKYIEEIYPHLKKIISKNSDVY